MAADGGTDPRNSGAADLKWLPYRYEVTITVAIAGDGQHADGDGAKATANRLAKLIALDDHVDGVVPGHPEYIGKSR